MKIAREYKELLEESLRNSERLRAALVLCVKSLRGYRMEMGDSQPCDAENNALTILMPNATVMRPPVKDAEKHKEL